MVNDFPSFGVVIPMFNEEHGARECIEQVCAILDKQSATCKLLVVNDGSSDQTRAILEALAPQYKNLLVIHHECNQGYGTALCTGMQTAHSLGLDYALFMDSDLTNNPKDIPRFMEKMKEGYDVIKATRYSLGGHPAGVPWWRVLISWLGNRVASLLFGLPIHDCTNGFRAVRTKLLVKMKLKENKFPVIMEELFWAKHLTNSFTEIPVILTNRAQNLRATSFAYRPQMFWNYFKYPWRAFLGQKPDLDSISASEKKP